MRSTYIPGYTKSLDFSCEFYRPDEIIMPHDELILSLKTLQLQSRHGARKYFAHQPLWLLSTDENPRLELHFAIIPACIPTLRPLFRPFSGNQPGGTYAPNQGFVKQGKGDGNSTFHTLNEFSEAGPRYDITSIEPSQSNSRSGEAPGNSEALMSLERL